MPSTFRRCLTNLAWPQSILPHRLGMLSLSLSLASILLTCAGCGESTHDAMLRRAQERARLVRANQQEDEIGAEPSSEAKPTPDSSDAATRSVAAPEAAPAAETSPAESNASPAPASRRRIVAIDERRPSEPLTHSEKWRLTLEHAERIGQAIESQVERTNLNPFRNIKDTDNEPLLSWRVRLLPDLGLDSLYAMFDLERPWDHPENLKLLPLIPDEFVSLERWDEKTNFLAPAGSQMIGDPSLSSNFAAVLDGRDRSIVVVEVNHELAIPWTRPDDFRPTTADLRSQIGTIWAGPAVGIMANGSPVILSEDWAFKELIAGMRVQDDAGPGFEYYPSPDPAQPPPEAAVAESTPPQPLSPDPDLPLDPAPQSPQMATTTTPEEKAIQERHPVPTKAQQSSAMDVVRELFETRAREARRDPTAMRQLLTEMIESGLRMKQDPTGQYTLLKTAANLSTSAGQFDLAHQATVQLTESFDIDARQTVLALFESFSTRIRSPQIKVDMGDYDQIAAQEMAAAIALNRYGTALDLLKELRFAAATGNSSLDAGELHQLELLLKKANGYYNRIKGTLTSGSEPTAAENQHIGEFLCFVKGDWDEGLDYLAQGEGRLAEIALVDRRPSRSGEAQVEKGDRWWQLATTATNEPLEGGARERAAYWYRTALPQLPPSLKRTQVEARVRKAGEGADNLSEALKRIYTRVGIDSPPLAVL